MEEIAAVPPSATNADALVPHLKKCGYSDAQLVRPFKVGEATIDVAAFAGKPFDNWSACLAAVNLDGDSKASAAKAWNLGAASVFVCGPQGVDWYGLSAKGPTAPRNVNWADVPGLFREHKKELAPSTIYDAKLRRPGAKPGQMWFFDAGLMPAVEKDRGKTLLRLVENAIGGLTHDLGKLIKTEQDEEDVYRTVFWQLAAKLLHDKGVEYFKRIDLHNVEEVFERIGRHHGEVKGLPAFFKNGRDAIDTMARLIAGPFSLADVLPEAIADVYENALLDKTKNTAKAKRGEKVKSVRQEHGIHGTPFVLINHMLSQLWPMLDAEVLAAPHVFEPACGHAPFLMRAMRWLRQWDDTGATTTSHDFMRKHLRGVEKEPFSLELAKLALTLADEPHGNSWAIQPGDMFAPGVLAKEAKKARILLSNPPYEAFTDAQRKLYAKLGEPVTANTKAVEVLKRTLPHLPPGGVFGVVMPVGVLHDKESKTVREELLKDFDLSEISVFADNLFEHGDHEVAVLMGRKKKSRSSAVSLMYRRVREAGMAAFKERLAFSSEDIVDLREFARDSQAIFRLPDLRVVWSYCDRFPRLGESFSVSKGHEFYPLDELVDLGVFSTTPKSGWLPLVLNPSTPYSVVKLPVEGYLDYSAKTYRARGGGAKPGVPQVVINESGPRAPWRFRAVEDPFGMAIQSRFLVARAKSNARHSLTSLWAVLNSPVANAFAYCWSEKRHTTPREWLAFPLPELAASQLNEIEHAAARYRALAIAKAKAKPVTTNLFTPSTPPKGPVPTDAEVRAALLAMDAAVLRAYALPVRLERQLLDLFNGAERKGVGCIFGDYFPADFKSLVPLHKYISTGYRGSTVDQVAARMKPDGSSAGTAALRAAAEAFGGDD